MKSESQQTVPVVLFIVVLTFVTNITPLASFDIWYHLSLGRHIAEQGRMPRANLLSYTAPEYPVLPLSWLFQWAVFQLHQAGGTSFIILARAAAAACILLLLFRNMRTRGAGLMPSALMLGLAAWVLRPRFVDRPQMVGYLFLAGTAFLLLKVTRPKSGAKEQPRGRVVWALLPAFAVLQALWANAHGSAILGLIVSLAVVAGTLLPSCLPGRPGPGPRSLALLAIPGTIALASGLNPMGWQVLTYPLAQARSFEAEGIKNFFAERVGLGLRDLWGAQLSFGLLLIVGALVLILCWKRISLADYGLLASVGAVFLSARFVGESAILVSPILAEQLSRMSWFRRGEKRPGLSGYLIMAAILFASLTLLACVQERRPLGFGIRSSLYAYPIEAAEFVEKHYAGRRLFNDFEVGGYLAWRRMKVFIDSRGPRFYPPELMKQYVQVIDERFPAQAGEALSALEREYNFSVAIVHHKMPLQLFKQRAGWRQVHSDEVATVFVKAESP